MKLSDRQNLIIDIVKEYEPITSDEIAMKLSVGKSTIRNELVVLGMLEILEAKPNVGYYYNYNFVENKNKNSIKEKKVEDVMGVAITAKSTTNFSDVMTKLFVYDVGTIFILDDEDSLAGVISRKDMLKLSRNSDLDKIPIALGMTRIPNVIYVKEDELVSDALRKIIMHEVDCLPVIREEGSKKIVIGRISKTTLIKLLLEILEG